MLLFHLTWSEHCSPHRAWSCWWVFVPTHEPCCRNHHSSRTKGINRKLDGIFLFEFLWFIIQLPSSTVQLGSDSCWGLAAAVSNRQLNIYIPLSSSKQTPFWGSAVWALKLFLLCACLHKFYNIFHAKWMQILSQSWPSSGVKWRQYAYV